MLFRSPADRLAVSEHRGRLDRGVPAADHRRALSGSEATTQSAAR